MIQNNPFPLKKDHIKPMYISMPPPWGFLRLEKNGWFFPIAFKRFACLPGALLLTVNYCWWEPPVPSRTWNCIRFVSQVTVKESDRSHYFLRFSQNIPRRGRRACGEVFDEPAGRIITWAAVCSLHLLQHALRGFCKVWAFNFLN